MPFRSFDPRASLRRASHLTHDLPPDRDTIINISQQHEANTPWLAQFYLPHTTHTTSILQTDNIDTANIDTTNMNTAHTTADSTVAAGTIAVTNYASAPSGNAPARASLLGIPPELRNNIYKQVAAIEGRLVVGKRIAQPRGTRSYSEHLRSAVVPHPLSMTCHQIQDEFSGLRVAATDLRWVLLVNNFDLLQVNWFSEAFDETEDGVDRSVVLRLHMDNNAVKSARDFCKTVLANNGGAPTPLCVGDEDHDDEDLECGGFGVVEIVTNLGPEHAAQQMTLKEAMRIEKTFKVLRRRCQAGHGLVRSFDLLAHPFDCMEYCWFEPFYEAVAAMRAARITKG